jgi:4-hydroxybenzoate polyprenyltransferase
MIRIIAREIVYGGHLLALGTVSIAAFCSFLINRTPTFTLLLLAYLFSYGAYTLDRSVEMEKDSLANPERTSYLRARKKLLPFIFGTCFAIGYLLAFFHSLQFFFGLLVPLLLSFLYSLGSKKLVRVLGAKRLKESLLVKNIVISLAWSLIPFLVGLYFGFLVPTLLLIGGFIFLRLLVNTIFFDARDVAGDAASGVRTIPVVYGTFASFRIMTLIDICSALYVSALVALRLLPIYSLVMIGFTLYSVLYRHAGLKDFSRLDVLCDVVGDGEYALWGAVLLVGKFFIV